MEPIQTGRTGQPKLLRTLISSSITIRVNLFGMTTLRIALVAACIALASSDFHYDNEIIGEPEIECGYGVVNFKVRTTKGQASQVFVKGNSENKDCVFHNTGNVTIDLSKCNIRRKREVSPTGITYAMTVIVQLHPLFVTKIDRAYNVNCFYMEKKQDVNIEFGVSELTTQSIAQDATTPTCTYTIHRDSPNGPIIQYGKVGDIIYHKWECPSPMYKMLLSLCKAVDGKGKEYPLQDEHGCSTDRFLFPEVTYSNDVTTAMVETSAFNFPDQNNVAFTCKIQLCYQQDNCDSITPPRCGHNKDKDIELNGDALHGNDLNDDQLISSTVSDERISTTSAEKSTERAFAGDTEATTLKATTTTTEGTTTSASTTVAATTKAATTQPSTTKSSTSTSTTTSATSTTSTTTTTTSPVKSASSTKLFIPADFPRPDGLEEGSGEVDAWMVSDIPEASENRNDSAESTPPPVQVLKKNKKRTPQAQRPVVTETTTLRAASRQQRNATPRPSNLLDMDVTNDLTVIDDYLNNAEQATQAQKQVYRDLNETPFGRGVCFSPVALLCGVLLILLLFVSVIFVLFRSRRSSKYYGA